MYTERVKTPEELFFFFFWALRFVKVEASQRVCQCKTVLRLSVCVRACERLRWAALMEKGALRQVSSLLTQTVNSTVGKVCPTGALYFSNNSPLVRLPHVYDLNK